ncbi:MAG: gamma-glutamyltransferase family protein [Alphaproteobacteria bacterium]|nr:gamma-glutamyltransferase family protein [Alphaproteobacteria bacterium]
MSTGAAPQRPFRPSVTAMRHVVSAGHHMASLAGFQMLEAGGNAIDAGIAAALATNVLQCELTGLAGIAPAVIHLADSGRTVSVTGSGPWPKLATCEYFHKHHRGEIPLGILESMVPGAVDSYLICLAEFGTMSFAEVAAPAIRLARDGFPMYPLLAQLIREKTIPWPTTRAVFFPNGKPIELGEVFVQADLGRTLQFLADEEKMASRGGRKAGLEAVHAAFYRGDIARKIDAYYRAEGGLVRYEDMAAYRGRVRPTVASRFAGVDVHVGPFNGIHFIEALNILDGFDLKAMGHNSVAYIHTMTEAFKLAFADREAYVGDPDFVDVPVAILTSRAYADERRRQIRPDRAWPDVPSPGDVGRAAKAGGAPSGRQPERQAIRQDGGTSYLCAVDRQGNAFSMLVSGGNANAPVVPGTGFGLAHFGICGWTDPKHPNAVMPGKRTRTAGPAIAIREGKMVMPFGTPGSDVIPQAMTQVLCNMLLFGMDPQLAVEMPRFASYSFPALFYPHAYVPGLLKVEESLAARTADALTKLGHVIEVWPERIWRAASVCAIVKNLETGVLSGGADPRRDAYAIGW